jgi:hypothetical protein
MASAHIETLTRTRRRSALATPRRRVSTRQEITIMATDHTEDARNVKWPILDPQPPGNKDRPSGGERGGSPGGRSCQRGWVRRHGLWPSRVSRR